MARWSGCFWIILILTVPGIAGAPRQSGADEHKAEVGAVYTGINLKGFGETVNGVGGRFVYNINSHLAVDGEASFFPEIHFGNNQVGQKVQLFIGGKAGVRSRYVGVFVKARPGVMSIGEVTSGFSCGRTGFGTICRPRHNNFALDLGVVGEFYPSSRTIIRFDAGDTIVRMRTATAGVLFMNSSITSRTTQNFQFSVGLGYRF
jgi:hypothetical protein